MFATRKNSLLFPPTGSCRLRRAAGATGIVLGLLCGVHCVALPTITAIMLLMGVPLRQQATLEVVLMGTNLSLAALMFLPSASAGRNPFALQAVLMSLLFFVLGWQLTAASDLFRQSLTVSASVLLIVAHGQHLWALRRSPCALPGGLSHCGQQS